MNIRIKTISDLCSNCKIVDVDVYYVYLEHVPCIYRKVDLSVLQEHCSEEIEEVDGQLNQLLQDEGRLRWAKHTGAQCEKKDGVGVYAQVSETFAQDIGVKRN